MKSITINDVVYSVGDDIFIIPKDYPININTVEYCYKGTISKITPSGYVYVNIMKCYKPYVHSLFSCSVTEERLNKDGTLGNKSYITRILSPYSSLVEDKINEIINMKEYIQNTFNRLKEIKKLSYNSVQKINALLDEIGIDKVEEK